MTKDGGKRGDPGVDIDPLAMRIDQSVDGERMSQIMFVPTSAQARLCRPPRYADLGWELLA
jgi:hypothetical protein